MPEIFIAYASGNDFHKTIIEDSAKQASSGNRKIFAWSANDPSGDPIDGSVEKWIAKADSFIADITTPNHNVIYELGYALGLQKSIRLLRSSNSNFDEVKRIGLVDSLAHDPYDFQPSLVEILKREVSGGKWNISSKNKDQPIFILQTPEPTSFSRKTISLIKKKARFKFRNFNPAEISRLTANEAYEIVSASFGVIGFWEDGNSFACLRNNQRVSFIFGLARGLGIPVRLIAQEKSELPLDINQKASRWSDLDDLDGIIQTFRDDVADEIVNYVDPQFELENNLLRKVEFGDPVAENEQSLLSKFFLETDGYARTLAGEAHVLVGRKGSGKSAIFLQVRDRCRANKENIVVDLMPEGYQLIKLKEYILDRVSLGVRKQIVSAFWEYIIWLEIAYKILEKDKMRSRNDHDVFVSYSKLEEIFHKRSDTGIGDFSERLRILSDNIIKRFTDVNVDSVLIDSSKILEIIYGEDVTEIRNEVLSYLKIKGYVYFLFDNLDRVWTPGGFTADDATLLIGLSEAMQEISRRFRRQKLDFRWALFVRSDVYEHIIRGMADYGKLAAHSIEWSDRDQLMSLFNQRLLTSEGDKKVMVNLMSISDRFVDGIPVLEYLIDKSLMRPRYLIRLFETARRRALTLGGTKITEDDYQFATQELGWQVLEDFDREVADIVPDGEQLLYEIIQHHSEISPDSLRYICKKAISDDKVIERFIDVLVWSGAIGVVQNSTPTFIFDCGYRRQYLGSLINNNPNIKLELHPTLRAIIE